MKNNNKYLPRTDNEKAIWLKNFTLKLAVHGEKVGILPDEILGTSNDAASFIYSIQMVENLKSSLAQNVAFKKLLGTGDGTDPLTYPQVTSVITRPSIAVKPGIFKRLAKLVQRIKFHPNYNESIGKDLGIIAPKATNKIGFKPKLNGGLDAGRPLIKWKKGQADSLDIYVDRNDGNGFIFLVNDYTPDYIDTNPIPDEKEMAIWAYKGIYRIKDEQVGEFSEIIKIAVTRQVAV
ncbi:MAG: hypothetical protein J7604_19680 [Sporocytophaga sp.]|uniref:hypothetical protein n=1 Tax=Sporocytophaga sp. TaxID=2231183 RepID=UPI001B233756|nr:hypothetical protein [Sporocytophaga sp.]MBO9702441.1 hypothetical protein [Sporocytophaga sp.]